MTDLRGTRETIVEIDIGELGTYYIKDDGDEDDYVLERIVTPDGTEITKSLTGYIKMIREDHIDSNIQGLIESSSTSSSYERPRAFSCDDCHRTYPGKDKHTDDGAELCPECYND